jgi:hypothetical protein
MLKTSILVSLFLFVNAFSTTEGDVTAEQLLAVVSKATMIPETKNAFRTDEGAAKTVSIYQLTGATTWTADMDIDCDGATTTNCNSQRDPWYQNQTSCCGGAVAAENTPYFVIPIGSPAKSSARGISWGQVAAVIYKNQVVYAMFADECGDSTVIGEASYGTAKLLGIDPDPKTGGTDGPVTYIVFTGTTGRLSSGDRADHQKAIDLGTARAHDLVKAYSTVRSLLNTQRTPSFEIIGRTMHLHEKGRFTVSLFSLRGRKVGERTGFGSTTFVLPITGPGFYAVTVHSVAASATRRIIVP